MKKWYQSTLMRSVLMLVIIFTTAAAFASFTLIVNCSGDLSVKDFFSMEEKVFEETYEFESLLHMAVNASFDSEFARMQLETDGEYDPKKLVDIMEYAESGEISGKNESGLAYTVEDLLSWYSSIGFDDNYNYRNNNIIVCQKPDGTYYYYYTGEFKKLLEEGELRLELDEEYSTTSFLEELNSGYYNSAGQFSGNVLLKDKEGVTLYTDCWAFTESLDEFKTPQDAKNILEVVNSKEELNGRLSEVCNSLEKAMAGVYNLQAQYDSGEGGFSEGNTNFTYYLLDKEEDRIYTNNSVYAKEKDADKVIESIESQNNAFVVVKPKLKDFVTNMEGVSASTWKSLLTDAHDVGKDFVYIAAVDRNYPIQDMFYESSQQFHKFAPYLNTAVMVFIISVIVFCICIVWLTVITGRTEESGETRVYKFDRWKTEIAAIVIIGVWVLVTAMIASCIEWGYSSYEVGYYYYSSYMLETSTLVLTGFYGLISAVIFLIGYLSLIRRIKAKTLWKDSLCRICLKFSWKCCKVAGEFWRHRSVLWKMVLAILVFFFLHWIAFTGEGILVFLMLVAEAAAALWLLWEALCKERTRKGIRKISEGEVSYQISTDKMRGVNKEIAENINHIGDGLQEAVNESMKSERLKTDLITNVSHDIKTPLTSIINYVDLLKRENIEDPKIQGYIKILEEKAQRLKTLTEDVVEASKVSSGNISLEYMDVNFIEMLNQTIGEFSERFEAKGLKIVENVPEEPVVIHVDNRRVWRILENIFNNAAKYSMPGTRVYADLKKEKNRVIFSLKNISEQPLNIQAEELTERFIRGDISRSTEGSGLGLSIAKNLTELQGGRFNLYLDGDLFKVTIEFPIK